MAQWLEWLDGRDTLGRTISRAMLERHLHLLVTMMAEMVGPWRREVKSLFYQAMEHYGRAGATRGLAAGEVVEELQYLRDLLTRQLAPVLAAMRARQAMAIVIHHNPDCGRIPHGAIPVRFLAPLLRDFYSAPNCSSARCRAEHQPAASWFLAGSGSATAVARPGSSAA